MMLFIIVVDPYLFLLSIDHCNSHLVCPAVSFGVELSSLFEVEKGAAPDVVLTIIEAVDGRGVCL